MRKVEIPRHTILAPTGNRFLAALLDIVFTLITFLLLYVLAFSPLFNFNLTGAMYKKMDEFALNAHLVYKNEDGTTLTYHSDDDYTIYETSTRYFYLTYLTGEGISEEYAAPNYNTEMKTSDGTMILPKDYYTVSWYNLNVLGIDREDPDSEMSTCYFTYQKVGETYDKNQIGIPREKRYSSDKGEQIDITKQDLAKYMLTKYEKAYTHLTAQNFYSPIYKEYTFYGGLSAIIPLFISGLVCYVIIPFFRKDGATLGKMLLKLGLANFRGYKFKKSQLLMRFIPYVLVLIFMLIFYFLDIVTTILIVSAIVLVSFGLSMGSPRKSALHDFVAQTMVIDARGSIIFNDEAQELDFLEKEEMIINAGKPVNKRKENEDEEGEEPPISYEK